MRLRCKEWRCWRFRSRRADGRSQAGALDSGLRGRSQFPAPRDLDDAAALHHADAVRQRPVIWPLATPRTPAVCQARKRNHRAHTSV
jgi:hypothetical protein